MRHLKNLGRWIIIISIGLLGIFWTLIASIILIIYEITQKYGKTGRNSKKTK